MFTTPSPVFSWIYREFLDHFGIGAGSAASLYRCEACALLFSMHGKSHRLAEALYVAATFDEYYFLDDFPSRAQEFQNVIEYLHDHAPISCSLYSMRYPSSPREHTFTRTGGNVVVTLLSV